MRGLWLFVILVLFSCTKSEPIEVREPVIVRIDELPNDIKIPTKAWEILLSTQASTKLEDAKHGDSSHGKTPESAPEGGHKTGTKPAKEASLDPMNKASMFLFSRVSVLITQKNSGVVKQQAVQIDFSKGGGEIDLANYINDKNGTFYVSFVFPEWLEKNDFKALFISRTQRRRIGGEIYGSGCNKLLNITKAFEKNMKQDGLKINTTGKRHLNVLGGTFVFSAKNQKDTFLTQVTFNDSQNHHFYCQDKL